jgi:hypothetical protein
VVVMEAAVEVVEVVEVVVGVVGWWRRGSSCRTVFNRPAHTVFACFVPKMRHVNNRVGGPPTPVTKTRKVTGRFHNAPLNILGW